MIIRGGVHNIHVPIHPRFMHVLLTITYSSMSISAVMLDRMIAVAQPILYRKMVQQRRLKRGLLLVLKLNAWGGGTYMDCFDLVKFRFRRRCYCSVRDRFQSFKNQIKKKMFSPRSVMLSCFLLSLMPCMPLWFDPFYSRLLISH